MLPIKMNLSQLWLQLNIIQRGAALAKRTVICNVNTIFLPLT